MTDAALPHSPTASQLSENIGDVLASIRRMIAQDGPALAPPPPREAAVLRLDAAHAVAADTPPLDRAAALRRAVAGRSAALLTEGAESPAGQRWGAALTAGPEVPVADVGPRQWDAALTAQPEAPASVPDPQPLLPANEAEEPSDPAEVAPATAEADSDQPAEVEGCPAGSAPDAAEPSLAAEPEITAPPEDTLPGPARAEAAEATAPADLSPAQQPAQSAMPPTADMAASAPLQPEPPMTALAEMPSPQPEAGMESSILGTMIRELVRQELQSGGMSRDLRAMVLREVARAITGPDAAKPVLG